MAGSARDGWKVFNPCALRRPTPKKKTTSVVPSPGHPCLRGRHGLRSWGVARPPTGRRFRVPAVCSQGIQTVRECQGSNTKCCGDPQLSTQDDADQRTYERSTPVEIVCMDGPVSRSRERACVRWRTSREAPRKHLGGACSRHPSFFRRSQSLRKWQVYPPGCFCR
jgi:hypothetical protein